MTYDYLIIGAGSAGAPLAARLSEDPQKTVLLIEAGPDYRSNERPSAMLSPNPFRIILDPDMARYRYDDLQARRSSVQDLKPYWRGRGIGGCSAMNGQIAIRGMLEDYDDWAEQGCAGWSGQDVLPYLNKLERDFDFGDKPYHGDAGPIPVYRAPLDQWGPVDKALREAALALGYGWNDDCNAPDATGVSPYPINSIDGVRVSTADGYLEPVRGRSNLTILGDTLVDVILFEGDRATGVRANVAGEWQDLTAQEVIIAAGAVHSPAILERSGIGKPSVLQPLGITVRRDLPVGENLVEHSGVWIGVKIKPEHQVTSIDFRHTNCCVRYSSGLAGAGANDMIMIAMNLSGDDDAGRTEGRLIVDTFQTFSRGDVHICSTNPNEHPLVDLRMLSDERDMIRMRDGFKRLFAVTQQPAFKAMSDRVFGSVTGEELSSLPGDEVLDQWLLAECFDAQHPVGTCRMGAPDDPRSVVDPDCQVIGIKNLRVIDASVMPENPRANTHFSTIMIAERMADRIRQGAAYTMN